MCVCACVCQCRAASHATDLAAKMTWQHFKFVFGSINACLLPSLFPQSFYTAAIHFACVSVCLRAVQESKWNYGDVTLQWRKTWHTEWMNNQGWLLKRACFPSLVSTRVSFLHPSYFFKKNSLPCPSLKKISGRKMNKSAAIMNSLSP